MTLKAAFLRLFFAPVLMCSFLFFPGAAWSTPSSDFLFSLGLDYYQQGLYDDALIEFNKCLLVDPEHPQAAAYIQRIKEQTGLTRRDIVTVALDQAEAVLGGRAQPPGFFEAASHEVPPPQHAAVGPPAAPAGTGEKEQAAPVLSDHLAVSGVYQVALGARSDGAGETEVLWKEANADLNERNYRVLFGPSRQDTYDPGIYSRLRVNLDTKNLDDVGLYNLSGHANLTVDPWSFTGKTQTFTLDGAGGDRAQFELKYWSNTGRTINEIVPTLSNGDAMALPEIKVVDGRTTPTQVSTTFTNIFNIPSQKVQREFLPLREFWLDYNNDPYSLRVYPIAYQDQAMGTNDPLRLSNNFTWWEESPWLAEWKPGNLNTGAVPNDFAKGYWDDSLAFFTRDSDGLRLTALRGARFSYDDVDLKVDASVASPKNLWGDYGDFETYAEALRVTYDLAYNLSVGLTHTGHYGYKGSVLDGLNSVVGADATFEPVVGNKLDAEVAYADSTFDRSNDTFVSRKRGNAYLLRWVGRYPQDELFETDYFAIRKKPEEGGFLKWRFQLARMEDGFDPSLSTYRQTRDDEFWSRHISFRKHPLYLYTGVSSPVRFEDIAVFGIGNGIDIGRDVIGLRLEGSARLFERALEGLLDIRNVHEALGGGFIENVSRVELRYPLNERVRTKFLGIRQNMPKCRAGLDPFIFDPTTGKPLVNTAITGGEDPSLGTVSLGAEVDVTPTFSLHSVWERTNDTTVATDNFPRGLFNSSSFTTLMEDGKVYREPIPFLYSQTGFDLPPYEYIDILKNGFSWRPWEDLEFYIDFAYNANKKAGQIDDNMNHAGIEVAYRPLRKFALFFKYTYARWIDMLELNATGREVYSGHHNIFFETRYEIDPTAEFVFMVGVGGITPVGTATYDPFGGALAVLDTQHIVRVFYRKRF
ncbi:MAG: tetratricopeptide repeat protein [Deltaproteobacteria bacterium]